MGVEQPLQGNEEVRPPGAQRPIAKPRVAFIGSGGLLRSVSHLGVLRAMEELGIEADLFLGASTGAVIGAFASQGVRADAMVDWLRPADRRRDSRTGLRARDLIGLPTREQWRSPGWLLSGIFSAEKLQAALARDLPCDDFRKLERSLLITAADMDGRGRAVFGKGYRDTLPISEAVAASCSVPLLYRPKKVGDRYFVDGEIVRTLSLDLAVAEQADVVIVSNVYRPTLTRPGERSIVHAGPAAVFSQSLNIVLSEKERRGIELTGRLHPDVAVLEVSVDHGATPLLRGGRIRGMLERAYREALRVLSGAKARNLFDSKADVRRHALLS